MGSWRACAKTFITRDAFGAKAPHPLFQLGTRCVCHDALGAKCRQAPKPHAPHDSSHIDPDLPHSGLSTISQFALHPYSRTNQLSHINYTMALHRASTQLETFVTNTMNYITATMNNTVFEYWLLDRQGQVKTAFFTFLIGIVSWLLLLEYSSRAAKKDAGSEVFLRNPALEMEEVPSISSDDIDTDTDYTAISIMSSLAPSGHRTTNANLNTSVARPLNDRKFVTLSGAQVPLPRGLRRTPAPEVAAERELDAYGEYSQVSMLDQLEKLEGDEAERLEEKIVARWGNVLGGRADGRC
jgi:hypothetical protein